MPMNGCVSSLNIASDYEIQRKEWPRLFNRFPRGISGVLPVLSRCGLPRMGCDAGRA